MSKFIKFGRSSTGELVYRSTGKVAPEDYTVKGNTVYKDGRKIGNIGKGTKAEQRKIEAAQKTRTRRRILDKARAAKIKQEALRAKAPKREKPRKVRSDAGVKKSRVSGVALKQAILEVVLWASRNRKPPARISRRIQDLDPEKLKAMYVGDRIHFELVFMYENYIDSTGRVSWVFLESWLDDYDNFIQ